MPTSALPADAPQWARSVGRRPAGGRAPRGGDAGWVAVGVRGRARAAPDAGCRHSTPAGPEALQRPTVRLASTAGPGLDSANARCLPGADRWRGLPDCNGIDVLHATWTYWYARRNRWRAQAHVLATLAAAPCRIDAQLETRPGLWRCVSGPVSPSVCCSSRPWGLACARPTGLYGSVPHEHSVRVPGPGCPAVGMLQRLPKAARRCWRRPAMPLARPHWRWTEHALQSTRAVQLCLLSVAWPGRAG